MSANAVGDNKAQAPAGPRRFLRFDVHQRIQHGLMAGSFVLLVLTGWPLKMAGVGESRAFVDFFGGLEACGLIHRLAAVAMIVSCVYHLGYLVQRIRDKTMDWGMLPKWRDIRDLRQNLAYFVGQRKSPPRFGRWTYFEKFDYWAVFWGIVIMVGSGFVLWFPEWMMSWLPVWVLSVAHIAHSDEALLAALAIFIWHFYNVHLRRHVFPMNPVWLTGYLSEEQMKMEHAEEYDVLVQAEEATQESETGSGEDDRETTDEAE